MLAAHSMGSHGGQQNFPFGYIPNELHGIGLPDFMTPGPPSGQPLLSEHDTQNLDSFLSGFDIGGDRSKDGPIQNYQQNINTGHEWVMPPTFVGSETSLRPRNSTEWPHSQMSDFAFGHDMSMATMSSPMEYHNVAHGHGFTGNGHYDHNLLHQLHDAAQTVQPAFAPGWQQNFPHPQVAQMQQPQRHAMRFGSDSHFQPSGYAPPDGQFDPTATPSLDWLEAHSSAPNTQPNTEPNTQPSSPNWSKKRKLDDYQTDSRRNGFNPPPNGHANHSQIPLQGSAMTQAKRPLTAQEPPPTPKSRNAAKIKHENENAIDDEDADYDEDDDPDSRTRSASPSNSSKAKRQSTKSARVRKKSTSSNGPNKLKPKLVRSSTGGASSSAARVPLTADQKKANHTNSEQRRRDATARSYAELYDLVPELEDHGKQSTMKKLEIVVKKVEKVKDRVQQLRAALGFDIETGAPLQHNSGSMHMSAGATTGMGGSLASDMGLWPQ